MQRIQTPDGNFHPGDPSAGVKGTVVTQRFMQAVQEELAAMPESVGMKLDPADNKQILKAILKIVGDASANYQPALGYVPVQQGTGAGQGNKAVKIGWAKDGSGLRVTVDTDDLGTLAFSSQLAAYASQEWVKGYAVNKAGDTMGPLTLASANDWSPLVLSAKDYAPRIQADNGSKSINFVNAANNAANMWVVDGGQVSVRGALTVGGTTWAGGDNATVSTDGNVFGKQWGGWLRTWLDNNLAHKNGETFSGRVNLSGNTWQADFALHNWKPGQDVWVYLRARDGGGLEVINSAYSRVVWSLDDEGGMFMMGERRMNVDGNIRCGFRNNGWLSDIIQDLYNQNGGKAAAGGRVQWDSGVAEFDYVGSVSSNVHGQVDLPAPWVVTGLRVAASTSSITAIWQRGVVLRNQ